MGYLVIYDGNCNLCVTLVQWLEKLDAGHRLCYAPMQDQRVLSRFGISPQDCEQGMILIDADCPERRWQGSDAVEKLGRLLPPLGNLWVAAYRALPGLKRAGDRTYEQLRDRRYALFGRRATTYRSRYPACGQGACSGNQPGSDEENTPSP